MKETINYYYNLDIDNIEEDNGKYHFVYQKQDYYFVPFNRSLDELEDIIVCSSEMKAKGIDCHNIILNKKNLVLTKVGDYNYILLSLLNKNEEFDIVDIINFNKKLSLSNYYSRLYRNNWPKLWSAKVDYFEYQIRELGYQKNGILSTFSYYIGLAENAISYANNTINNIKKTPIDKINISHRRIFYPNTKLNYLNPLSFIFDLEIRDIAEYVKAIFFSNTEKYDAFEELSFYLKSSKLSIYSYQMLYARLLYPSYYFDIYEDIMNNNGNEDNIINIVKKVDEYELFLKKTYIEISKYANIEKIDWLIN